jgi:hypothetical protein
MDLLADQRLPGAEPSEKESGPMTIDDSHAGIERGSRSDERATLLRMISGLRISQAIAVTARLGIADLLSSGARSSEELARASAAHEPSLYRLLRVAAGLGILEELDNRRFSLTSLGEHLRSDAPGTVRPLAMLFGQDPHWRVWGELFYSVQTGKRAFDHVYRQTYFEYLAENPDDAAVFNDTMIALTAEVAPAVAAAYDFSGVGTLVDVGGGRGHALVPILRSYPGMRAILFDLPHVAASAVSLLSQAEVGDRCQVIGGDMFQSVPRGGDVYLLKHVIHDWDDDQSLIILKNCRRAMNGTGRLLMVERDVVSNNQAALPALLFDLSMMIQLGGRERTEDEYRALLQAAGFTLRRRIPATPGESVLEAIPA